MKRTALILFFATLILRALCIPFMHITYDEAAYSWTARDLALNGGWLDLYGRDDLFFFPPLFNYIAAIFIKIGLDRLYAVRLVTVLFSSAIPPLMYLLAVRSGLTGREGLIAAVLWIILPWGWYLSVAGMVETPWIACLLAAAYFLQNAVERGSRRDAILSAIAFAAALWIKETALGALPLFIFALRKDRPLLTRWGIVALVLALPLILQSFLPHRYDLFFEVTTPLLLWRSFELDALLRNISTLYGAGSFPWPGWDLSLSFLLLTVGILSVVVVPRAEWKERSLFRFAAGFFIIYLPFFALFPKKFHYYLLPVLLLICFFVARYLATRPWLAALYGLVALLLAVPAFLRLADRSEEEWYREAFRVAIQEKTDARIGLTLPRKAEYIAERAGMRPNIVPVEWVACAGNGDPCIFRNDFLLSDPMFLMMLYCRQWPMSPETCDTVALSAAKDRLVPVFKRPDFTLYRVGPPPEGTPHPE